MKPSSGDYRLTADPPNQHLSMTVRVDATGMDSLQGRFSWDEDEGVFVNHTTKVIIECSGMGRFKAIVRPGEADEETYVGDCVQLP